MTLQGRRSNICNEDRATLESDPSALQGHRQTAAPVSIWQSEGLLAGSGTPGTPEGSLAVKCGPATNFSSIRTPGGGCFYVSNWNRENNPQTLSCCENQCLASHPACTRVTQYLPDIDKCHLVDGAKACSCGTPASRWLSCAGIHVGCPVCKIASRTMFTSSLDRAVELWNEFQQPVQLDFHSCLAPKANTPGPEGAEPFPL